MDSISTFESGTAWRSAGSPSMPLSPGITTSRSTEAARPGHHELREAGVRPVRGRLEGRPLGVRRLADALGVGLGVEDPPQTGSHHSVVVHDEHTDAHRTGTSARNVVPLPALDSIR